MAPTRVTYVGHATVLLELDGARILTDPLLRSRVFHLRRHEPVAAGPLRRLDAVLVSHAHWDHLDLPSLRRLEGAAATIVVPHGAAKHLRRSGFGQVVEIDVGADVEIGPLRVTATEAQHEGARLPFGDAAPALGYVIEGSTRVYFAGDTDLFDGMSELSPLDLALVPVSGWGPRLPAGHLDPRAAAEALRLLRPRVAIPIHWGTYSAMSWRQPRPSVDTTPPTDFERHAAELAPGVEIRVLAPGESTELEPV